MITVHHLDNSRSQRILWLLEELGLDYELKLYQRNKQTMLAPPELREVHPLGKAPVLTDGDVTVAESGAIIEYLLDTYGNGRLRPAPGTPEHRSYTYWLHYAEGSAMTPLLLKLIFTRIPRGAPFLVRPIASGIAKKVLGMIVEPQLRNHTRFIEAHLAKHAWFAGPDLTGADIQMSFPLEGLAARGGLDDSAPHVKAFLAKIHARPAYRKALERGGPYALLGGS